MNGVEAFSLLGKVSKRRIDTKIFEDQKSKSRLQSSRNHSHNTLQSKTIYHIHAHPVIPIPILKDAYWGIIAEEKETQNQNAANIPVLLSSKHEIANTSMNPS